MLNKMLMAFMRSGLARRASQSCFMTNAHAWGAVSPDILSSVGEKDPSGRKGVEAGLNLLTPVSLVYISTDWVAYSDIS